MKMKLFKTLSHGGMHIWGGGGGQNQLMGQSRD